MILGRWYNPSDDEIIYHYCPSAAFLEIVKSRTMWLTSSHVLNDATERQWGYAVFAEAAKQIEKETSAEFVARINEPVTAGMKLGMLMIACFSLDGDMLSQWRAYADDGRGFSVGFVARQLEVPAKQLRVLYREKEQIEELVGNLRHIFSVEKANGFKYGEEFQSHVFHVGLDLCAYKNPVFQEEKEIRLAHFCGVNPSEGSKRIVPAGARDSKGNRLSEPLETHFRMRDGVLVPYVVVDYTNKGKAIPLKQVILGPRNPNSESNIEMFLHTLGFSDVTVGRSRAPYR
jgi:hypothetical protein